MVNITLNTKTRSCIASSTFLGYEGENSANKLIFTFNDEFVDGSAQLNIKRGNENGYVALVKVGETYELEVKSSLVSRIGDVTFQLQVSNADGTIYKYDAFVMTVKDAIDSDTPLPEDYPTWQEAIATALAEMENVDISIGKIDHTTTVTVTDKKGVITEVEIHDGADGKDGADGITPHIGENGNWWIGNTDTGVKAEGSGSGGLAELPIATADTLGGIKVGEGLEITEDGVLNALGGGSSSSGDAAPVGNIISFMGTIAPDGYLICDGTVLNIADYPKLASHFETQFGSKSYFGGDGVTTFAVPDLRNEFLRGYGDLSNDVGIHQDGTAFPNMYIANNGKGMLVPKYNVSSGGRHESINRDSEILESDVGSDASKYQLSSFTGTLASNATYDTLCELYTSRPTNVAVLYCIKY